MSGKNSVGVKLDDGTRDDEKRAAAATANRRLQPALVADRRSKIIDDAGTIMLKYGSSIDGSDAQACGGND